MFVKLGSEPGSGLIVIPDSFLTPRRQLVVSLASQHRIPTVYAFKYWVQAGGLVSYGSEVAQLYRNAASYISRIINGESPRQLPVMNPTKYELAINLRTAKALGLTIPPALLALADEVIE